MPSLMCSFSIKDLAKALLKPLALFTAALDFALRGSPTYVVPVIDGWTVRVSANGMYTLHESASGVFPSPAGSRGATGSRTS